MTKPKVIFLDAVGTIFGVKGSVGEVYSAIARDFGVTVAAPTVNRAFSQSFKAAKPPAFPGAALSDIPSLEFQWWETIARTTFDVAGVLDQFSNFRVFFNELYSHFAGGEPWHIYPDVLPALESWQAKGIELGVISNFDTRLHTILEILQLRQFFSTVTISSTLGAAKPSGKIFLAALEKHHCLPEQAWHIGDSLKEDYYAAKAVGIRPFLVERFEEERKKS
jgi:putative hydrolase of the HAD superfamily